MVEIVTVDATGVQPLSLGDTHDEILGDLSQLFGADLSLSPQTPQGQIGGVLAVFGVEVAERVTSVAAGGDLDTAVGTQLDAGGSWLQIRRRPGTHSLVTATLTGVAGVVVPAESRAAADGQEFETLTDVVLAPAGVEAAMQSVEVADVEAPAGTLTRIVTVVTGWETVTNNTDAVVGQSRETDLQYRASQKARVAQAAVGPVEAIRSALANAVVGRYDVHENPTAAADVIQEFTLLPYGLLVVAETGTDTTVRRAVEEHRGMGVPTMTAFRGAAPDDTALAAVTDGSVTWAGVDYTGLDLSSAASGADRAAALTALIDGSDVAVGYIDGRYVAQFGWHPDRSPAFADGSVETAFGLAPSQTTGGNGPFVRTRQRPLTVTVAVTRMGAFPADGLTRIRNAVNIVIGGYDVGEQLWANDLLAAVESVGGTRVTSLTATFGSAAVSGAAVPADGIWTIPAGNLSVTVT